MGTLILQDGTVIKGESFGAIGGYEGEVVFTTSFCGYQESFSDPSFARQIVVMAYPEIGNCGINDFDFESDRCYLTGLVVKNYSKQESHYQSKETLADYLIKNNVIALENIDTRSLVKKITKYGTMGGFITSNDVDNDFIKEKLEEIRNFKITEDVLSDVSIKSRYIYNPQGKINIALIDYGNKKSTLAELAKRDCRITIYPYDTEAKEILENNFDAVFLSNGPGNPANYKNQILQIRQMMGKIPMFGICLGYQLLALAAGANTYKLKFGHRGANHPVINLENNKVMITSQNHGYSVDIVTLPKIMRPTYKNLNDNTLEGFEISSLGIYAVQFHPEANPGPEDANVIFDEWVNLAQKDMNRINEV